MTIPDATIYVVDDDNSVRRGLSRLIRSNDRTVETFGSAEEFLREVTLSHPGCLILDLHMPGLNGIQLQELLVKNNVQIPIIFLTANGDVPVAVDAMRAGAVDFLMKPVTEEELFTAIDRAISLEMEYMRRTRERDEVQARVDTLTDREREVMAHVIAGLLNKQIGERLGTTEKTVKVHRGRMIKKMRADSVADLVRLADKVGIHPAE
ncbi:MAG: response regulator [Verrucomicrobiales bacterium]|nr:response regulator transcription factor [Verrucomicrobiae bacterium]